MKYTWSYTSIDNDLLERIFPERRIHRLLKEFVKTIDSDIKVNMSGNEFYCYTDTKEINVSFYTDPEGDRLMYDFVFEKFNVSIHPFLMGILHECGHIMTFDGDLDKDRDILYYMLQLNFDEERWEEYSLMYFQIPAELEATRWAVEYYLSHKDYCDNFLKEIGYEA